MKRLEQLVVCSLEDWDEIWRRNQFLADRLLNRYQDLRILFVEPAADPFHELATGHRPRGPRLGKLQNGRLRTLRPLKPLPRRAGPVADLALLAQVRGAARLLGFDRPTLWLNDVTFAPLIRRTGWPTVYDVTDDWLHGPGSDRERERLRRLDDLALDASREVVVCSPELARSRGERRSVSLIPNAVDVEHFQRPRARPTDLPSPPVALYVGTLHEARLDIELVVELAAALDSLQMVFVGPDSLPSPAHNALAGMPNVHLLGPRPYHDVPAYLQHADVIIVPHRVDAFTESLDPIKAYECLAVERPVVATAVAGFRELGDTFDVVGRDAFTAAVEAALAGGGRTEAFAEIPSWDDRAAEFAAVLIRAS